MGWKKEFVDTFYEVIKKENTVLNELNKKNRDACHPHCVRDLTERQWQYLLFKGLLANNYFDRWNIRLEQSLDDKSHTKSRRLHADFVLAKTKYGKAVWDSQICLEMKKGLNKKVKDDYKRLKKYSNNSGLLVYKIKRISVNLEAEIKEFPEFKGLMRIAPGDMKVNVVNKGENDKPYYFNAVLLSW